MTDYRANRTYKDSLFRMLFSDKHELLSLYNAISGKNYDNPDNIEINTLQDVIYISVKNDISFVIRDYQLLFLRGEVFFTETREQNLKFCSAINQCLYGFYKHQEYKIRALA
ncbi:MAG: hypothetical protein R3Y47_07760 [Lachnospiraceae bacterium]